ncbi:GTP-binding protein Rheb isoform X1 [Poecilia formosa]|uniref:GTP-binding protein Rheb isoform X1 n=1 Tax=Poecilia formosa TaxID=48698 RepID=UPI0007B887B5|nr:PREDICTED: uncharacterized protein LOC103154868 isoform X1 [Poecilia formosa]
MLLKARPLGSDRPMAVAVSLIMRWVQVAPAERRRRGSEVPKSPTVHVQMRPCRRQNPGRSLCWSTGRWASPEPPEPGRTRALESVSRFSQSGVVLMLRLRAEWFRTGPKQTKPVQSRSRTSRVSLSAGKSSLTIQFVDSYSPTIENIFTKTMALNGQQYNLQLVDTAGQSCTTDVNGYALIYSVTSYKRKPIILVGNKDLHMERYQNQNPKQMVLLVQNHQLNMEPTGFICCGLPQGSGLWFCLDPV